VSGLQSGLISAHIAARRYAETIGVPTADIDKDENKVALLELLEKTLDTFEWTFDAEGNTSLLYPLFEGEATPRKEQHESSPCARKSGWSQQKDHPVGLCFCAQAASHALP
jgi:hypothetical protein